MIINNDCYYYAITVINDLKRHCYNVTVCNSCSNAPNIIQAFHGSNDSRHKKTVCPEYPFNILGFKKKIIF